jgi:hypothetical protein
MKRLRRLGRVTTRLVTVSVAMAAMAALSATAAGASTATPRHPVCNPVFKFTLKTKAYKNLGNPSSKSWTYLQNKSSQADSLQLSFGTNSQVGYSIQASQSVEAGVIFAKVAASITEGISYTHTDIFSKTATVKVPAHHYGEAGVANIYAVVTGKYKHTWPNCKTEIVKRVLAKFPTKDPTGFITDTTKKIPVKPPWALAPR